MGAIQNSLAAGACSAIRMRCQPSSIRSNGPGNTPLKRRFWRTFGSFKKRSGSAGARRLMMDSMPTARGFAIGRLNFTLDFTSYFAASRRGGERKTLHDSCLGVRSRTAPGHVTVLFANEVVILGRGGFDSENAAGKSGIFLELDSFVFGCSERWIKEKYRGRCGAASDLLQKRSRPASLT